VCLEPAADEPRTSDEPIAEVVTETKTLPTDVALPTEESIEPILETPIDARRVEIAIERKLVVPRPGVEPPSAA
jgi:hypothetical protein